jgi:hypothetical protein
MRLFKSPWAYLFWLALFLNEVWHDLRPHAHPPLPPWHPLFNGILFTCADIFLICLVAVFARLTTNALEKAALALVAISFALTAIVELHSTALRHIALPSFRFTFLALNTLLVFLTAIRFVQVLREPPQHGILSRMPTSSE